MVICCLLFVWQRKRKKTNSHLFLLIRNSILDRDAMEKEIDRYAQNDLQCRIGKCCSPLIKNNNSGGNNNNAHVRCNQAKWSNHRDLARTWQASRSFIRQTSFFLYFSLFFVCSYFQSIAIDKVGFFSSLALLLCARARLRSCTQRKKQQEMMIYKMTQFLLTFWLTFCPTGQHVPQIKHFVFGIRCADFDTVRPPPYHAQTFANSTKGTRTQIFLITEIFDW